MFRPNQHKVKRQVNIKFSSILALCNYILVLFTNNPRAAQNVLNGRGLRIKDLVVGLFHNERLLIRLFFSISLQIYVR